MNKVFHTERIGYEDRTLMAAVLHENCAQVSTLRLNYRGYEAGGLTYRDQVTLLHRGAVLFHGQVTDISQSGEGTDARTVVTVSNLLWQMSRLTLGEQLADLRAAEAGNTGMDWKVSAEAAMGSWQALQGSCTSLAEGWSTRGTGIRVEVAEGLPSVGRTLKRIGAVSQWTAMRALQQANPGTVFRVDYEEGVVRIEDVFATDPLVWNTEDVPIASAALSPQYGSVLSGVAVAVNFTGGVTVVKYPASIDPGEDGVRLFTASAQNQWEAGQQGAYIARQLEFYFDRASRLQNRGSIRLSMADLSASPISRRVLLVGNGTHEQWGEVDNIVAEVEWDLMRGTADLSVGLTIDAPDFDTLVFDSGGGDSGDSGGGGVGDGSRTSDTTTTGTDGDDATTTARPEKLRVELDGEVRNQTEDAFTWLLKWTPNKEISNAALYVDGSPDLLFEHEGNAYSINLVPGLHTATVVVWTENGEQASASATVYAEPVEESPTETGGEGPDGPTPPTGGGADEPTAPTETGGGEVLHAWATQEGETRGEGSYDATLQAHTNRTGVFNYAWLINGQQLSGETFAVTGLNYDQSYSYTLTVTDTDTQEKSVFKGQLYESALEAEFSVQFIPEFFETLYEVQFSILSALPPGCSYYSFIAGGSIPGSRSWTDRDYVVSGLRYGETYVWNAFIKDAAGNTVAWEQQFIYYAAAPTPTTTGGGGETPTGGGNTPTGGGGDTPTGGGNTPTGGGGDTPSGGETPTGGGDTPTGGETPTGGGDTPTGGDTPNPPTGGGGDTPEECPCDEKWTALEGWKADIAARLAALENQQGDILARLTALEQRDPGTGGCDCDCAGILSAVQEALANAVSQAVSGAATRSVQAYSTQWSDSVVMDSHSLGNIYAEGNASVANGIIQGKVSITKDY